MTKIRRRNVVHKRELRPEELQLYKRCDEVLHYVWDPIGVSESVAARDEYSTYVWLVFGLVQEKASQSKIADFLVELESKSMGLNPDRRRADKVAGLLVEWRQRIDETLPRIMH